MKKHLILLLLAAAFILSSCSKYGYVKLDYPLDPEVMLPEGITSIAVVNRCLTKEENKSKNLLESIATAEIAGSDKLASDEALKGAFDKVNGRSALTIVIPQKTRLYGSGSSQTPELLDWREVKKICDANGAQALLVLESFDSNSDLLTAAVTQHVGDILQGNAPKPAALC